MAFYEQRNPTDITLKELLPLVKKYLKNVTPKQISFIYHGTYNVFDIDSKYMLRVPDIEFRNEQGLELIRKEKEVLSFLVDKLPMRIPTVLYMHELIDLPFIINSKIPGLSLCDIFSTLSSKQKISIGQKIAEFLTALHSKTLLEDYLNYFSNDINKQNIGNFPKKVKKEWEDRLDKITEIIFPILNKKQKNWLKTIFNEYLCNNENFIFQPCITHSDFDTSNILIDPETLQLTGIIDFETIRIYDPAYDLIFHDEGLDFHNAILSAYKGNSSQSLFNRMKFFYCRTCIEYIEWGIVHKRPGLVDEGFRIMNKNMKFYPE